MEKEKTMKVTAEIVHGECPTCSELTMLVGLTNDLYRCMNCGADLEQHINGKMWPNKDLHTSHLVTNLRKEALENIKNH